MVEPRRSRFVGRQISLQSYIGLSLALVFFATATAHAESVYMGTPALASRAPSYVPAAPYPNLKLVDPLPIREEMKPRAGHLLDPTTTRGQQLLAANTFLSVLAAQALLKAIEEGGMEHKTPREIAAAVVKETLSFVNVTDIALFSTLDAAGERLAVRYVPETLFKGIPRYVSQNGLVLYGAWFLSDIYRISATSKNLEAAAAEFSSSKHMRHVAEASLAIFLAEAAMNSTPTLLRAAAARVAASKVVAVAGGALRLSQGLSSLADLTGLPGFAWNFLLTSTAIAGGYRVINLYEENEARESVLRDARNQYAQLQSAVMAPQGKATEIKKCLSDMWKFLTLYEQMGPLMAGHRAQIKAEKTWRTFGNVSETANIIVQNDPRLDVSSLPDGTLIFLRGEPVAPTLARPEIVSAAQSEVRQAKKLLEAGIPASVSSVSEVSTCQTFRKGESTLQEALQCHLGLKQRNLEAKVMKPIRTTFVNGSGYFDSRQADENACESESNLSHPKTSFQIRCLHELWLTDLIRRSTDFQVTEELEALLRQITIYRASQSLVFDDIRMGRAPAMPAPSASVQEAMGWGG